MATLIKIKENTKARLKRFAVKRFGDDVGNATTFDAIVSVLLKEAEAKPFDFNSNLFSKTSWRNGKKRARAKALEAAFFHNKLAKLIERGVK